MEYTQLSPLEIRDLINQYRSDLRKLHFQTIKVQSIVKELEQYVTEAEQALSIEEAKIQELPAAPTVKVTKEPDEGTVQPPEATKEKAKPKKKRGRPKGSTNKNKKSASKRGPGRPPKKKKEKESPTESKGKRGRPAGQLSEWDNLVIKSLKDKNQVLTTSDFASLAVADPSIKSGEAQIKVKLNRSLHKLANKKELLSKVDHSGRGFAYALKDWFDSKGNLPKKYERK